MSTQFSALLTTLIMLRFVVASWFLTHFLALFGVFLAVAYPVWWLFFPKTSVCLLCRAEREGSICPLCRREIKKNEGLAPSSLTSATLNGVLILIFSIISLGLVLGESKVLFRFGFPPTPKTVSFIIPTKGQYRLGEIFPMRVEIVGVKTPINAVQADLGFDSTKIEASNISFDGSFASIFVQKEINNQGGYVRLTGGLPNPGFFSERGTFGTIYFRGKSPGVVKISYLPSSLVLANDGKGTNVLKDLASVSYFILPEKITEEEEKMQKLISTRQDVLGESQDATIMTFFEENRVLGANIGQEPKKPEEEKKADLLNFLLGGLGKIDNFILELWSQVYNPTWDRTNSRQPGPFTSTHSSNPYEQRAFKP